MIIMKLVYRDHYEITIEVVAIEKLFVKVERLL